MKNLAVLIVLVAGVCGLAVSPASAQTQQPYRYCMIGTPNMGMDCTFPTLQQCQVAASAGVGFCQENSAYIANARPVPPPMTRR